MSRLSALRRLAPLRSCVRRSPEVSNGLVLDKSGYFTPQTSRSAPWCSPAAASETPGWLAFETFLPVPYFRSLPVSSSSAFFIPSLS
ncbi:hypothetical protein KSP40_PGU011564 [Platanthera guangdongensis]|uniref:Uncharacterized protein n=1 Tax=Platanthera guangdongensis TaxID=2320717 RepID=A0ABR2LVQ0_9ASPA